VLDGWFEKSRAVRGGRVACACSVEYRDSLN
jgi:hypothetical protein